MESARAARIDDGDRVAALRGDAARSLAGARGAELLITQREARAVPWERWVQDPDRLAVVGTLDLHVVGYGLARLETLENGERIEAVEEVWVQSDARGVGVGEALMTAILEWGRAAGCRGIDGDALPGDRVMKGFFERYGLTARLLVMHHRFAGPSASRP